MAWTITSGRLGLPALQTNHATQGDTALGTIVQARDPDYGEGEFIYLKGVASTAVGSWVTYNTDDFTTTLLAANAIGPVAIAMSACVANEFGWYQISGKALGKCLTAFADNARVWITGTAGSVDDASVAGDGVNLAKGASLTAVGSGVADFEIHRPWVNDRTSFS